MLQTRKDTWQELLEKHPNFNAFMQSSYITVFTDWFTTFGAKTAHIILIVTLVYMGAELLVSLPPSLNLTMFVLQFVALDLGGIGLKTAARQATHEGNLEGADEAMKLGSILINILFATIVVAIIKQFIGGLSLDTSTTHIVTVIENLVEGGLLVARGWCAVRYGPVIHGLKKEGEHLVDTLQETIGNLQQDVVTLRQELVTLRQEKVTMEGNHKREMVTLKGNYEEAVGNLQQEVVTLKGNLDTILDERDELRRQMADASASVQSSHTNTALLEASYKAAINRLETENARLLGDLSRERDKVARVTSQVTNQVTNQVTHEGGKVTPIRLPKSSQVTTREVTSLVTTEGDEVTSSGNTKDRIKAAMQDAVVNNRKIIYREIAEVANTTEAYVKKFGAGIKKELGLDDANSEELEVLKLANE